MGDWLTGHWVLITAVQPREREELARLVAQAGGESQTAFSVRDPPHVVVTRSVRSPKYRSLLRAHPHTPVVTPEWLAASARAGRLLPYADFKAGPFTGLTVCFSGLSANSKTTLAALVVRNGGQHSPALDKKCTHLVTNSTDSEKYRFAQREAIPVVTTRWVDASLEAGWCQDEAAFALLDEPREGAGQSDGAAALLPLGPAAEAAAARRAPPTALLPDETTILSELAPAGGGGFPPAAVEPSVAAPAARGPSRLQRGAGAADIAAAAAADEEQEGGGTLHGALALQAAAGAAATRMPTQEELDEQLEWNDDTPTFLDAVRLKLLGCSQPEMREALGLVRQGAAKRFADWRDDLNYLVVGSELGPGEAAEASDFLSTHRACVPVSLDWLRECVAAQERLLPDGFTVPFSRLSAHRRKLPALEKVEAAGRLERSNSFCSLASDDGADGEMGRQTPAIAAVSGPLDGCYFTLAAIKGSEHEARARRLIQENGGRVFTETTLTRVQDKSRAYAICPPSLVATEITQLRSNCPDFKLVDERQRFTVYWLECSLLAGEPLPPTRGAPLYQPLPYSLPLAGMSEVMACTSGYDLPIRVAIGRLVETLGGKVTDNMTRRNTHLILPFATGRKFEFSASFGVTPVTADWLVDTVQLGRRQPEGHYRPRPPPEEPAGAVAAPAARLATADGGEGGGAPGCTEIGVTQMGAAAAPEQHPARARRGTVPPPQPPQLDDGPLAEVPARQQLVLPPPPGPQQEAAVGTGGRRPSLRERLRANQAAAGAGGGWPAEGQQQQQQLPVNDENVAGQGSNSGGGAADLLQLGGKQQLTTRFQQQQQPAAAPLPKERSVLDEAMASLDVAAQQAEAPVAQQAQQQVPTMFEALFGPSPHGSPALPPVAGPEPAAGGAAAEAAQVGTGAAAGAAPGGFKQELRSLRPSPKQPAGRGSGRATRASSRLRPADVQPPAAETEAKQLQQAAAEADDAARAAAEQAAAVVAAGSEPQEDMAKAIDSLGRLLGGLPAEAPVRIGSQLDALMPPPPARTRAGSKRSAAAPAESSRSSGSAGGSRGGRGTKRQPDDDGPASGGSSGRAQPVRRSGRGRAADLQQAPHLEMSQQVGYADSLDDLPAHMPNRSASISHNQLLKQRLAAQAAGGAAGQGGRRGAAAARSADPLADLLKPLQPSQQLQHQQQAEAAALYPGPSSCESEAAAEEPAGGRLSLPPTAFALPAVAAAVASVPLLLPQAASASAPLLATLMPHSVAQHHLSDTMYWGCVGMGAAALLTTMVCTARFIISFFPSLEREAEQRRWQLPWVAVTLYDPLLQPVRRRVFGQNQEGDLDYAAVALLAIICSLLETLVGKDGMLNDAIPDFALLQALQWLILFMHGQLLPAWVLVVLRWGRQI